ncbi:hypothetical protein [Catellatospora vulcania]|uniref:hypothetical protein n=1 Tax=Catellatospora vulcania TaxID=1460450 RepID=UPI0012D39893|nr:hypothetical protein [Catellatospora vulcania]
MRVLFLALGATRRRAVVEESARVVAAGGDAVVLLGSAQPWAREDLDPRVRLVDLGELTAHTRPVRWAQALLVRLPRRAARLAGRGRLREPMGRAWRAYERGVAQPVHRRLVAPASVRWWRGPVLRREVAARGPFDLIVVADPLSMPDAARLLRHGVAGSRRSPRLAFVLGLGCE